MKMIVAEDIIQEIVSQIPEIHLNRDLSNKVYFGWGNKKELNKVIKIKSKDENDYTDPLYPLIWLLPSEDKFSERGQLLTRDCSIIIATLAPDKTLLNKQRWKLSFKLVLNPLANFMIEGFETSGRSRIEEDNWKINRFSDYSDNEEGGNTKEASTIDLWDAVKLDVSVEFTNNCLKKITWQTKQ